MTSPDASPSRDELLAMAFVDGELEEVTRREFEARLGTSPALTREVAELQRLAVLARQAAPPEPMDYEWQRIAKDPMQRALHPLGWILFGLGAVPVSGWAAWVFLVDDGVSLETRAGIGLSLLGLFLLFVLVLRNRLRTLPFDAYRDVQR